MTPERVKAIAETAWIQPHYRPLDVAIERAITQAVNEALEEAANTINPMMIGRGTAKDAIRALKLPEE